MLGNKSFWFRLTLVAAFALWPQLPRTALAGEKNQEEGIPDLVGADETGELEDELAFLAEEAMVESAARHMQPLLHSPSAITLITRKEIEATGARVLPEVLRLVPGVDVYAASPFWYEMNIRGAKSSFNVDSMLLLVDGRDMTVEYLGFPMWTGVHFSMDEVKTIETIRGPGSALYGANAFSGMVSVKTFSPGEGPEASLSVRGGERGDFEIGCRGRRQLGSVDLAGSVGMLRQDRWTSRGNMGVQLVRGRLGGEIDLGAGGSLAVEAGTYYNQGGKASSDVSELDMGSLPNLFGIARYSLGDLLVRVVYDYFGLDLDLGLYFATEGLTLARAPRFDGNLHKSSTLVQHSVEIFHNRITYGAEHVYNRYHIGPMIPSDQDEHRAALFIQDELDLRALLGRAVDLDVDYLMLTAGLRVDYNTVTQSEISPRVSLVWAPEKNHGFRLGYAHAFLKPTFFAARMHIRLEDVLDLGFDEINYDATGLRNETIDSLEAGYMGSFFDDRLRLGVDWAYSWYEDAFIIDTREDEMDYTQIGPIRIPDPTGPGFYVVNKEGYFYSHSLELHMDLRIIEGLSLFGNLSLHQLLQLKGGAKPYEEDPIWRLAAGAIMSDIDGWSASVLVMFAGSHEDKLAFGNIMVHPSNMMVPSAWFVSARIARTLMTRPFEMTIGLECFNLAGVRFRENAGISYPNGPDYNSEMLDRRIVLFLRTQI